MANDGELRLRGWVLSKLLQTEPKKLEALRAEKFVDVTEASAERLLFARRLIDAVAATIREGDDAAWARLQRALSELEVGPSVSVETAAKPAAQARFEPDIGLGSTAPVGATFRPATPLPFVGEAQKPSSAAVYSEGGVSLDDYAQLSALRAKTPQALPAALERRGIQGAAAFDALDRAWQARIRADSALSLAWVRAYQKAMR